MTYNYEPGSFADRLVESFSGPHDWLNSTHFYGADGNISNAAGLWGKENWNTVDVFLAAPMGISTFCTQNHGMCSNVQNAVNSATYTPPPPASVVIRPPTQQQEVRP